MQACASSTGETEGRGWWIRGQLELSSKTLFKQKRKCFKARVTSQTKNKASHRENLNPRRVPFPELARRAGHLTVLPNPAPDFPAISNALEARGRLLWTQWMRNKDAVCFPIVFFFLKAFYLESLRGKNHLVLYSSPRRVQ